MINIRPVSDLRNKFPEIEKTVINSNSPLFLTKNGYKTMVLMSFEKYSSLTNDTQSKLDKADVLEENSPDSLLKSEVFNPVRYRINEEENI